MEPVNKQTFPFKLYNTIEWASNSEFSSALTWSPSGHAFVVHDRDSMVENVIPNFFEHKKWRSFTRQLNLWGFKRELRGTDSEGETYYHPYFKRGKLEELQLIQRTEIKRRSVKKQLSALSLPNQSSAVAAIHNHGFNNIQGANPRAGVDITQGASFLTGLKGPPDAQRVNEGGFPTAAYYGNMQDYRNMQGPGQMSRMIPHIAASLPPTMHPQMMHPHMLQSHMMMQHQMMMQPPMFQGYPTGNWNPNPPHNQLNRETLNNMPTQQLVAMASNMNGPNSMRNMNGFSMLQPNQTAIDCNLTEGSRAVSGSSLNSSSALTAPRKLDSEEGNTNEGPNAPKGPNSSGYKLVLEKSGQVPALKF